MALGKVPSCPADKAGRSAMDHPNPTRTEEFVELSSSHQRQLLGYIFTLVGNMDDAEDLLQQTNLILWRKFDDYQPGTDFIRWACYVAAFGGAQLPTPQTTGAIESRRATAAAVGRYKTWPCQAI